MATTVKKYRTYCNDEATEVTGFSETEPTTCFNNNTHTIDTKQTAVVDVISTNVTLVQTNADNSEHDNYYLHELVYDIAPEEEKTVALDFDVNINMFSVKIHTTKPMIGDVWSSHVNKDTVIGVVAEAGTDITEIKMADTSVAYIKPGYYIRINGAYTRVLSKTVDTFTVKDAQTVGVGNIVMLTYFMIFNKEIRTPGLEILGSTIFGSFRLLTSHNYGITYKNNSKGTKRLVLTVETTF